MTDQNTLTRAGAEAWWEATCKKLGAGGDTRARLAKAMVLADDNPGSTNFALHPMMREVMEEESAGIEVEAE